ncbi:MAG: hypothetical protein CMM74_12260 [Rhodospirillaceae bacterium]|nr:hypothetical protein [Rhodospirillaceae bacterium]
MAIHFGGGLAVFLIGAVLHYFRLFGGGDVKLLAAIAIWTGTASLGAFLFLVAIIGGCSCGSNFDHRSLQ